MKLAQQVRRAVSLAALMSLCGGSVGFAQNPTTAPAAGVPAPSYSSLALEVTVSRPAAEVWKRVGKYCDIAEWLQVPCAITTGKDGEFGAVRVVGSGVVEILVARTELSYTYAQPVRPDRPYDQYHGTLEARPVTATTSKLIYTLFGDDAVLPDAAAREENRKRRTSTFTRALANMKTLAEGGVLPPAGQTK